MVLIICETKLAKKLCNYKFQALILPIADSRRYTCSDTRTVLRMAVVACDVYSLQILRCACGGKTRRFLYKGLAVKGKMPKFAGHYLKSPYQRRFQ